MKSPPPSEESTQGETQFIPQSDDEETLWEVIEITAELPTKYKVKWKGLNPATGRPWPQSWVPKADCTDDLRREWKKKKKKKKEHAKEGKGTIVQLLVMRCPFETDLVASISHLEKVHNI